MIKSLLIKNFQSHKRTKLNFTEGVNIIVGPTDSGKSAIIRALKKVIFNKPGGESFRSYWDGNTLIKATTEEGDTIQYLRSDSKSEYKLNKTEFKAFKQDVPEEVEKAFNINYTNFQQQLDSTFLLSETAGNIASHFNKIANLDIIDNSLQKIQSGEKDKKTGEILFKGINTIKNTIQFKSSLIEEKRLQLNKYKSLYKIQTEFDELKEKEKRINNLQKQKEEILKLIDSINSVQKDIQKKEGLNKLYPFVEEIENLIKQREEAKQKFKKFREIYSDLFAYNKKISYLKKYVILNPKVNKLIELYDSLNSTGQHLNKIENLVSNIEANKKMKERQKITLFLDEKKFLLEMPDQCPLCDSIIKK